jgi:CBS-domain-containing membrane protein
MSRDLVLIPRQMLVRDAAQLLSKHRVTGAPVVDAENRCIGVVSATDFVHQAQQTGNVSAKGWMDPVYYSAWQQLGTENLPSGRIESYMTSDVLTATPSTPISQLARMMIDGRVHRVIILDAQQRPVGLVSTMDLLTALADPSLCGSVHWEMPKDR